MLLHIPSYLHLHQKTFQLFATWEHCLLVVMQSRKKESERKRETERERERVVVMTYEAFIVTSYVTNKTNI